MKFVFDQVEHILEKEENTGFQKFLLFSPCFKIFQSQIPLLELL